MQSLPLVPWGEIGLSAESVAVLMGPFTQPVRVEDLAAPVQRSRAITARHIDWRRSEFGATEGDERE
jgi:hypothetical protein